LPRRSWRRRSWRRRRRRRKRPLIPNLASDII
jgi:hypothetical protein